MILIFFKVSGKCCFSLLADGQLQGLLQLVHHHQHRHDDGLVAANHLPLHLHLQRQPSQQVISGQVFPGLPGPENKKGQIQKFEKKAN